MSILTTSGNFIGLRICLIHVFEIKKHNVIKMVFFKIIKKEVVLDNNCERVDDHSMQAKLGPKDRWKTIKEDINRTKQPTNNHYFFQLGLVRNSLQYTQALGHFGIEVRWTLQVATQIAQGFLRQIYVR